MLEINNKNTLKTYAEEQLARGTGQLASRRDLETKNVYDKVYNKLALENNKYLDDDFWTTAATKGELDLLVSMLSNTKESNKYLDDLQKYGNQVDYDTYMLALALPGLDNTESKTRLDETGTYSYGDYTDLEWAEKVLESTKNRYEAEITEQYKENIDWWIKAGAGIISGVGHVSAGIANVYKNAYNLVEGLVNLARKEEFLEAWADDEDEYFAQLYDQVKFATYELERNVLPWVNAIDAYEQGYIPPTDQDADSKAYMEAIKNSGYGAGYTTFGRYWDSGLQSIGEMLPFMFIPGGGQAKGIASAAVKTLKTGGFYITNVFSGEIGEAVKTAELNGISYKDLNAGEVVANAALKAAAQFAVEIILQHFIGLTGLDVKMGFGDEAARAASGFNKWFVNAFGATGAKAAGLAIGRGAVGMAKEGLEEVLQDLSDNLVDLSFGGEYAERVKQNFSIQNLWDAFVVGALVSGVTSTFSTAQLIASKDFRENVITGIDKEGKAYKLGVFEKLNYIQAMNAISVWQETLNDKTADAEARANAAFRLNAVMLTIGNVLKTFGTERSQKALQMLQVYQDKKSEASQKAEAKLTLSSSEYATEIYNDFVQAYQEVGKKYAQQRLDEKIKKATEKEAKRLQKDGVTKFNDIVTQDIFNEDSELPDNAVAAAQSLLKQTGSEALISTDGNTVVKSEHVIFAPDSLVKTGNVSKILEGIAYDKAIKAIAPELSKQQNDLLLNEYRKISGNQDANIEDVLIAVLFDKSFYTYVLLKTNETHKIDNKNDAIKILSILDTIIKGKTAPDVDKGTLTQAAYEKLITKIQENMRAGLAVYAMNYVNIDLDAISAEILPASYKDMIRNSKNVLFTNAVNRCLENKQTGVITEDRIAEFDKQIDQFKGINAFYNEKIEEAKKKIRSAEYNKRFDACGILRYLSDSDDTVQLTYLKSDDPTKTIGNEHRSIVLVTEFFDTDWASIVNGHITVTDLPEAAQEYIENTGYDLNNYNDRIAMLRDRLYVFSNNTLTVSYSGEIIQVLDKTKLVKKEYLSPKGNKKLIADIQSGKITKVKDVCRVSINKTIGNLDLVLNRELEARGHFNENKPTEITVNGVNIVDAIMHEMTHATQYYTRPESVAIVSTGANFSHLESIRKTVLNKIEKYFKEQFPLTYETMTHNPENNFPAVLYFNIDGEMQAMCKLTSLLFETGFTWNADKTVLYSPDGKTSWNLILKTDKRKVIDAKIAESIKYNEILDKTKQYQITDTANIINDVNTNVSYKGLLSKYTGSFDNKLGEKKRIVPGAIWFTNNKYVAETYADRQNGEVVSANLTITNPLIIDAQGRAFSQAVPNISTDTIVKQAKEAGYDSVIFENIVDIGSRLSSGDRQSTLKPSRDIVVFNNEQIKVKGVNYEQSSSLSKSDNRRVSESADEQTARMAKESRTIEERTDFKQSVEELEKIKGYSITTINNVKANINNKPNAKLIAKYKKAYVLDFKTYTGGIIVDGVKTNDPGFTDGTTVYLSEDYPDDHDIIIEHEYFHVRAINNPKGYQALVEVFKSTVNESQFSELLDEYAKYYPSLTTEERLEEILANISIGIVDIEFTDVNKFNSALKKFFKNKTTFKAKSNPSIKTAFYVDPSEKLMATTGFGSTAGLMDQLERGYLPAPSIAINTSLTNEVYGPMFLVYNTKAVEKALKQNRVYARDSWTGRRKWTVSRFTKAGIAAGRKTVLDTVLDNKIINNQFTEVFNKAADKTSLNRYDDAAVICEQIKENAMANIFETIKKAISNKAEFPTVVANQLGEIHEAIFTRCLMLKTDDIIRDLDGFDGYYFVEETIKLLRRGTPIDSIVDIILNDTNKNKSFFYKTIKPLAAIYNLLMPDNIILAKNGIDQLLQHANEIGIKQLEEFFSDWRNSKNNESSDFWHNKFIDIILSLSDIDMANLLVDTSLSSFEPKTDTELLTNGINFISEYLDLNEYKYKFEEDDRRDTKYDNLLSEQEIEDLQASYVREHSGAGTYFKVSHRMEQMYKWEADYIEEVSDVEHNGDAEPIVVDIITETTPHLYSMADIKKHGKYLEANDGEKVIGRALYHNYKLSVLRTLKYINKLGNFTTLKDLHDVMVDILNSKNEQDLHKVLEQFNPSDTVYKMLTMELSRLLNLRNETQKVPLYLEMKPTQLEFNTVEYIVVPKANAKALRQMGIDKYLKQYDIELVEIDTTPTAAMKALPSIRKAQIKFMNKAALDTKLSESRKISNKIAQESNLKYFIKPGRQIQLDERVQQFVINTTADFDKLESVIKKSIKDGTLTLYDIKHYVETADNINDYTFQMIAKYVYENNEVARLTYKDMKNILDKAYNIDVLKLALNNSDIIDQHMSFAKMENAYEKLKANSNKDSKTFNHFNKLVNMANGIYQEDDKGNKHLLDILASEYGEFPVDQLQGAFMRYYNGTIRSVGNLHNYGKHIMFYQKDLKGDQYRKSSGKTWNWIDKRKSIKAYESDEKITDHSVKDMFADIPREEKLNTIEENIRHSITNELMKEIAEIPAGTDKDTREEIARKLLIQLEKDTYARLDEVNALSEAELNLLYIDALGDVNIEKQTAFKEKLSKEQSTVANILEKRYIRKNPNEYSGKYASFNSAKQIAKNAGRTIAIRLEDSKVRYKALPDSIKQFFDVNPNKTYTFNNDYLKLSSTELEEIIPVLQQAKAMLGERQRIVLASNQSKIRAMERANRQAEKMLDRPAKNGKSLKENVDVRRVITIKTETYDIKHVSSEQAPKIVENVLATSWDKTRTTTVKSLDNNIDQNIANADTFYTANTDLLNMSTTEAEQAAKWFMDSTATSNMTSQDLKKFEAIRLYFLGFILEETRESGQFANLNANVKNQIENYLRDQATVAGTALAVWNNIRKRLNPLEVMLSQSVVIGGVELTEIEQRDLLEAAATGDMELVAKLTDSILSRIKAESKGKKKILRQVTTVRSASMLSGPLTWLRNRVSNFMLKRLNKWSSAIGQKIFTSKTKQGQLKLTGNITPEIQQFITTHFIDNKLFDTLINNISKYNPSEVSKRFKNKDGSIDKNAILANMVIKAMYGKYYSENMFKLGFMNKSYQFLMKMMSDSNYVREAAIRYFGKIIAEKSYDLSKGVTDQIMTDFANAVGIAMADYMHSDNFFNTLERIAAEHGELTLFIYKNILPYMATSWNWFKAAIRYSPVGLARSIVKLARLEHYVRKQEGRWEQGKSQVAPEYTEYLVRRDLGSGIIGTAAFGLGVILSMLGYIRLEDDDYGVPKLHIGNFKIDLSSIFGTSSVLAGAALVSDMAKEGVSWDTIMSGLDNALDVTLDGFFLTELMALDLYSGGGSFATLLDLTESILLSFIPNGLAWIAGATYTGTLRKKGLFGKAAAKIPFLAGIVNEKKVDPYTGKTGGVWDIFNRIMPYFDIKMTSRAKSTAQSLGLSKTELRGQYTINNEAFNLSDKEVSEINKQYG